MKTYLTYFDETGDDGITTASSDHFILTSIYMPAESWQDNFNKIRELRKNLKEQYGFHISEEMHTKHFLTDKNPYRKYNWSKEQKQEIIVAFTKMIGELNLKIINVIIDKTKIKKEDYPVLENALKYNIRELKTIVKENGIISLLQIKEEPRP